MYILVFIFAKLKYSKNLAFHNIKFYKTYKKIRKQPLVMNKYNQKRYIYIKSL